MFRRTSLIVAAAAVFVPSIAEASTITFSLANQTPVQVDNVLYAPCGTSAPLLPSVPANSQSAQGVVGCGFTSAVSFDYAGGDKKCRYTIYVIFNGQTGTFTPNVGTASAGAVKATCKVVFAGADRSGNYGFIATMQ